jgi:hypothetical protein
MAVKYFDWDDAKNAKLRAERGIGFEDIVFHVERGDLLDILEHPNPDRYAGQRIFVVRREGDRRMAVLSCITRRLPLRESAVYQS